MKYLLLAYADVRWWDALSASERTAFEDARRANDEALRRNGRLLVAAALQSTSAATRVQVQNGAVSVGDSAFVERLEQLSGIFFINARDLNEAISIASKMPQARSGPIEVRPINAMNE